MQCQMWHCIIQCKLQMPAEINSLKRIEEILNLIHDTVLFQIYLKHKIYRNFHLEKKFTLDTYVLQWLNCSSNCQQLTKKFPLRCQKFPRSCQISSQISAGSAKFVDMGGNMRQTLMRRMVSWLIAPSGPCSWVDNVLNF